MKKNIVDSTEKQNFNGLESFKYRSAIAVMLLVFAIIFDVLGLKPFGIEMEQIFETIAENRIK